MPLIRTVVSARSRSPCYLVPSDFWVDAGWMHLWATDRRWSFVAWQL